MIKHIRKGKVEDVFDDLDAAADDIEIEADQLASNALIPDDVWEISPARYLQTEETIQQLAREIGVSASIVAGRIRKEAGNYMILSDLVGQGQVRHQFPEARFGQ